MRAEIKEIATSCEFTASKYDELNSNLIKNNNLLECLTKEIEELKQSNKQKDNKIEQMQSQINALEQQMLKNNIEIKNIPPTNNENLLDIVKAVSKTINYDINDGDITDIYRSNVKQPAKSTLIASFSSYTRKTQFMQQVRAKQSIKLNKVNENIGARAIANTNEQADVIVYVNNQLTKEIKHLLWMAKQKAKQENWRYVWENAGRVLARKNESSQAVLISTANDVSKISCS